MPPPVVPEAEPADRRAGLALFGILDLVLAALFLIRALVFAFVAATRMNPRPEAVPPGELAVWALVALAITVFFGAIGVGSITGRRWARSLSLAFSSLWLAFGTVTVACMLAVMPRIVSLVGRKPPLGVYAALVVVGIVLPGAYLLFYRSAGVRKACEWLDPEERWTDRVPVIVLAVMMLLVVGASLALGLGFSRARQTIFLGRVLPVGFQLGLVAAAAAQLAVVANLPRRRRWAWIAAVAILAIRGAGDVLIARGLTIERFERVASSASKLSPRDAALLQALKNLHLRGAITAYVAALVLLSIAIAIGAEKWFRSRPAPLSRGN